MSHAKAVLLYEQHAEILFAVSGEHSDNYTFNLKVVYLVEIFSDIFVIVMTSKSVPVPEQAG